MAEHDYEAIMLSMKASEHQRKSPLQLSMVFQTNLPEFFGDLKLLEGDDKGRRQAAEAALDAAIDTYNLHGAVATQPRWQIRGEERQAVRNLALAVDPLVKGMMVRHPKDNREERPGFGRGCHGWLLPLWVEGMGHVSHMGSERS